MGSNDECEESVGEIVSQKFRELCIVVSLCGLSGVSLCIWVFSLFSVFHWFHFTQEYDLYEKTNE